MFQRWRQAKQRARKLKATIAALDRRPVVEDTNIVRFVMRSFQPPTTPDKAKEVFSGSYVDVSGEGFAEHGRCTFGLENNPATVLALRTPSSRFALLELVFYGGKLGMCGIDITHFEDQFIQAGMTIEDALRGECETLGYQVPTWHGEVISFQRDDIEGMWWSNLPQSGNVIRLVERSFGQRFLVQK